MSPILLDSLRTGFTTAVGFFSLLAMLIFLFGPPTRRGGRR